jgi:hypothetical protein
VGPLLNGSSWPDSQIFLSFVIFLFLNICREKMASDEDEWEKYYSDLVEGMEIFK